MRAACCVLCCLLRHFDFAVASAVCMLRALHWMPSSKNKALLSFLSARFLPCLSWSFVPQPVQHRPPHLQHHFQRCSSAGGSLCISSSVLNTHVDWHQVGPSSSRCDRPPAILLANDRTESRRQQQQRGLFCAAGSPRQSATIGPLMAGPVPVAAGGTGDVATRQQEQEGELVLDRELFSKETAVVAVKLPAKRTR